MNKLVLILKLGIKFFQKYIKEYLKLMLKPILVLLSGFLFLFLAFVNPIFAILALFVTIPCVFYSFWQGFLIIYSLNFATYDFIKENTNISLKDCFLKAKKQGNKLAKYVSLIALIGILFYLPVIFLTNSPDAVEKYMSGVLQKQVAIVMLAGAFIYSFLINYALQSFYYKKDDENIFKIFLNSFKKLDKTGIIIAILFAFINTIFSTFILLAPLGLLFCVYAESVKMLWYTGKNSEEN